MGVMLATPISLWAQQNTDQQDANLSPDQQLVSDQAMETDAIQDTEQEEPTARMEEAALNEDPEAQRRTQILEEPELDDSLTTFQLYGSMRLHAINNFNEQDETTEVSLGDGASRIGLRGDWKFKKGWYLFGRAEGGFDVLDTFTPKGTYDGEEGTGLHSRLLYGGVQSKNLMAVWGKNWSPYYQIAGMADRFSIFGGEAAGIYNAGTDGGATGTGRADDVLQARIYTNALQALRIKPFNLNIQVQQSQPIPRVSNRNYDEAYGASAWLESEQDIGLGVAWLYADIDDQQDPVLKQAGISGDAMALALAFRKYGERWYGALVVARLDNIETTDQFKYIDGYGVELYVQWQFGDQWWLIGGGNWLNPDNDDPEAGEYEIAYAVLGVRYTLDSFNRMLYAEYRIDSGQLWDGSPRKNEFTFGFRWDFGY